MGGFLDIVAIKIKIVKVMISITFLGNMLGCLKFMVMMALTRLGLLKIPPEEVYYSWENPIPNNYVFMLDGSSPSLFPVPVHTVIASIKENLPVLQFHDFLRNRLGKQEEENEACAVCLDTIEGSHEIRELSNCCHVFHRECLDTWVDRGHVTCPFCRSMLLPPREKEI